MITLVPAAANDLQKLVNWHEQAGMASTGKSGYESDEKRKMWEDRFRAMISDNRYGVFIINSEKPIGMIVVDYQPPSSRPTLFGGPFIAESDNGEQVISKNDILNILDDQTIKKAHAISMAIDMEMRGKGYGASAWLELTSMLREKGYKFLFLETGINNNIVQKMTKGCIYIKADGQANGYLGEELIGIKAL
jgi:ribosomal protein S18 acetylase RimI-like enzyme